MSDLRRFFQPPDHSYFLFGPRGTGKTTWLNGAYPDALYLNLLEADRFRELSAQPERLEALVLANRAIEVVVIDEVQRIPELLHVVHDLIERKLGITFVLTGSSARKLRRGGVDLLAGRAYLLLAASLHGRRAAAIRAREGPRDRPDAADRHRPGSRSHAARLRRPLPQGRSAGRRPDPQHRALRPLPRSRHLLARRRAQHQRRSPASARSSAKPWVSYLEILEDLLLSFRLPVFTRRAKRDTIAHPKLYFFDAGVFRSLRPKGPLDRPEEIEGAALEGLVAQHLRAWIAYPPERRAALLLANPWRQSRSISCSTAKTSSPPSRSKTRRASAPKTCAACAPSAKTTRKPAWHCSTAAKTAC